MTSFAARVWVRSSDGWLVRSDAIIGLRCGPSGVEACWLGGGWVRLAGPGCPPDFDTQLLAELAAAELRASDGRYMHLVSPQVTAEQLVWAHAVMDRGSDQEL